MFLTVLTLPVSRVQVDFGAEPDGPVLAHECRYPGGRASEGLAEQQSVAWLRFECFL
mgnify:CR=1 FL=1